MNQISEKDILIFKKDNGFITMSINIDIIKQVNFSSENLCMFSTDMNDFVTIEKKND